MVHQNKRLHLFVISSSLGCSKIQHFMGICCTVFWMVSELLKFCPDAPQIMMEFCSNNRFISRKYVIKLILLSSINNCGISMDDACKYSTTCSTVVNWPAKTKAPNATSACTNPHVDRLCIYQLYHGCKCVCVCALLWSTVLLFQCGNVDRRSDIITDVGSGYTRCMWRSVRNTYIRNITTHPRYEETWWATVTADTAASQNCSHASKCWSRNKQGLV